MRNLSSTTRSISDSEITGEAGDFTAPLTGKEFYKDLIRKANTVPLPIIFRHYGLRLGSFNYKITCPFKSHKGGRESTASFNYFPQTNSFHCFGCKIGHPNAHGCEFIAAMENITHAKAAFKILDLFKTHVDEDIEVFEEQNFSERLEIMLDFSNCVKEFRKTYNDEKSFAYIEYACSIYDALNLKHKFDNEALRNVVEKIKEEIISYTPCLTL